MKLVKRLALIALSTIAIFTVTFVAVVAARKPAPAHKPIHREGYAKVLSIAPVQDELAKALTRTSGGTWNPSECYSIRLQYIGTRGDSDESEPSGDVFEMVLNQRHFDRLGQKVHYIADYHQDWHYAESYFLIADDNSDSTVGLILEPIDPMPWLHDKEKSQGLAFLAGLVFLSLIGTILAIIAWLAPIYIAKKREHPNFMPITVITILLGWTCIGWGVSLAWSLSNIGRKQAHERVNVG